MKYIGFIALIAILFAACNTPSAQQKLLVNQWDCIKLENVDFNAKYLSPEDSAINAQNEAKVKTLSWQLKADNTYITSSADLVNTVGKYSYNSADSILTVTTSSGARAYKVKLVTENQLILDHNIDGHKIVMQFNAR